MTTVASEIIKKAINSPEFIEGLVKGFDLIPCIKKIVECETIIPLNALKEVLDKKIADLNIQYWFEKIDETRIIYVDIDGVICTDEKGEYTKVKPIQKNINLINKLYCDGNKIIIWTARGRTTGKDWRELTEKQLANLGVKYDILSFDKPYYDLLLDDKAI